MRNLILLAALFVLGACGSSKSPSSTTPAPTDIPPLTGSVSITTPESGSVVYSEVMFVSGTASDLPGNQFTLELVAPDDSIIAQSPVVVGSDGSWSIEIPHGYNGEPIEVIVQAVPENAQPTEIYDAKLIAMAAQSYRPEGTFGSISFPLDGLEIGGDSIEVQGTASGLFEGSFILELDDANGNVIDSHPETTANPYYIDEVPWVSSLATNGYTGAAVIRAYAISARDGTEIPLASVSVTITVEAG